MNKKKTTTITLDLEQIEILQFAINKQILSYYDKIEKDDEQDLNGYWHKRMKVCSTIETKLFNGANRLGKYNDKD